MTVGPKCKADEERWIEDLKSRRDEYKIPSDSWSASEKHRKTIYRAGIRAMKENQEGDLLGSWMKWRIQMQKEICLLSISNLKGYWQKMVPNVEKSGVLWN